jgi:hypothetical protein
MSTPLFSGVTAAQNTSASLPLQLPGDSEVSLYASGPLSGTWAARVCFRFDCGVWGMAKLMTSLTPPRHPA